MEPVLLSIDDMNELDFKINVTGTTSDEPVQTRLVIECDELDYRFRGKQNVGSEDGVITFIVPKMTGKIQEGSYKTHVEVLVEGKFFTPITFDVAFKRPVSVVVESVTRQQKTIAPRVNTSVEAARQVPIEVRTVKQNVTENKRVDAKKNENDSRPVAISTTGPKKLSLNDLRSISQKRS